MVVLVTGSNGQLGQALHAIAANFADVDFIFKTSTELDITNKEHCIAVFEAIKPDYCINAAAYTAVDKAESEADKAYAINVKGVENIAQSCKNTNTTLVHVSTDFVFDGSNSIPYTEEDQTNPMGVYGQTKLEGEVIVEHILDRYYIIRTSWVYSQFANNFMKTMLRLASERDQLSVVNDQVGTPTHAVDLANALLSIINFDAEHQGLKLSGIYNFSNEGVCTWYDFAKKIFEVNHIEIKVNPIGSESYPTPAKRPAYSVLDKTKIKKIFGIAIPDWDTSLLNNS